MKKGTMIIIGIALVTLLIYTGQKQTWLVTGTVGTGDKFAQCFNAQYSSEDIYITMSYKSSVPTNPLKVELKDGAAPTSLNGTALQTVNVAGSTMVDYYSVTKPITNYDAYLVKLGTFSNLAVGQRYCLVFSTAESGFMGYVPLEYTSGNANSWAQTCYPTCGAWQQNALAADAYMKQVQVTGGCNTAADINCNGCISDLEFPIAVSKWKTQSGITDADFPSIVSKWKTQNGC